MTFGGFSAEIQSTLTCFNNGGINAQGLPFSSNISVHPGQVKSLWIGFSVPPALPVGTTLNGTVIVSPGGARAHESTSVAVSLYVSDVPVIVDPSKMDGA